MNTLAINDNFGFSTEIIDGAIQLANANTIYSTTAPLYALMESSCSLS